MHTVCEVARCNLAHKEDYYFSNFTTAHGRGRAWLCEHRYITSMAHERSLCFSLAPICLTNIVTKRIRRFSIPPLFHRVTLVPFFAPRRGTPTAIPKSAEQRRELRAPAYFNIFVIHISRSPARKLSDIFCRDGRKSNYFIVTIFYRNGQNVARLFVRYAFIDLMNFKTLSTLYLLRILLHILYSLINFINSWIVRKMFISEYYFRTAEDA